MNNGTARIAIVSAPPNVERINAVTFGAILTPINAGHIEAISNELTIGRHNTRHIANTRKTIADIYSFSPLTSKYIFCMLLSEAKANPMGTIM